MSWAAKAPRSHWPQPALPSPASLQHWSGGGGGGGVPRARDCNPDKPRSLLFSNLGPTLAASRILCLLLAIAHSLLLKATPSPSNSPQSESSRGDFGSHWSRWITPIPGPYHAEAVGPMPPAPQAPHLDHCSFLHPPKPVSCRGLLDSWF